jgi:hypothetical protein
VVTSMSRVAEQNPVVLKRYERRRGRVSRVRPPVERPLRE